MSAENGESKPPKLKLSRNLKPSTDKPADPESGKTPAPKPPEPLKGPEVRKAPGHSATPSNLNDFDPDDPFGDILPKSESSKKAPKAKKPGLELDRSLAAPPPELPSKPPPRVSDGSSERAEAAIEELSGNSEPKKPLLPSILVVLALLVILGGAAAGIWYVLLDPAADGEAGTTRDVSAAGETEDAAADDAAATSTSPASGPISRTREVISTVPVADVPAINGTPDAGGQTPAARPAQPAQPARPAPKAAEPTRQVAVPGRPQSGAPAENLRESVSQFLTGVHVGGMRTGQDPRVMLDGKSYHIGDIVHPATGLTFEGTSDGRLLFEDRNGIRYLKSF